MSAGRLRCCEVVRRDLGPDASLVYGVHAREARVVPRCVADALLAARDFRPLSNHITAASVGRSPAEAAAIAEVLPALADLGLMVDEAALRRPDLRDEIMPPLDLAAIATAGRPASAARAAGALIANARDHGRPLEVFVADGSRDPGSVEELRARLTPLARAARIVHAGPAERRALVARLVARGVDPELAAFALLAGEHAGLSYGTGRNATLLHSVGRRVLCIDDDVIARPVGPLDPLPGLALYTGEGEGYDHYQPQDIRFYPDRAAALADARWRDEDVLGAHEGMLGRSLPALVADVPADAPVVLDTCLDPAILRRLRAGAGRVRVSFQGLLGDLGWYAPTWCLLFEGDNRERLVADEDVYQRTLTSTREALRLVRRATVGDGRYCQGAILGLDHRAPLPPFFPVGRYEDGVFRTTLRALDEEALFGHVPSALLHEPPEARRWEPGDVWRTGGWARLGEIVVQCLRAHPAPASAAALGEHLRALGRLPLADFRAFVALRLWRQKELYAAHLTGLLARHGERPRWWADDVKRHLEVLAANAASRDYPVPRDLLGPERGPDAALALAQRLIGRFGALLLAWPELCALAAELSGEARPLA